MAWASAEFEGLDEPLPAIEPRWSPVAHHGGYYRARLLTPAGVRQADAVSDASLESAEQASWTAARIGVPVPAGPPTDDPCFAD